MPAHNPGPPWVKRRVREGAWKCPCGFSTQIADTRYSHVAPAGMRRKRVCKLCGRVVRTIEVDRKQQLEPIPAHAQLRRAIRALHKAIEELDALLPQTPPPAAEPPRQTPP